MQTAAIAYVIMQGGSAAPDTQTHLLFSDTASGNWAEKAPALTIAVHAPAVGADQHV